MTIENEYDAIESGLLPGPQENVTYGYEQGRVPPPPMHRVYREIISHTEDFVYDQLESMSQRVSWAEDQANRSAANATAHARLAAHRGRVLAWVKEAFELDELSERIIDYALSDQASTDVFY